MKIIRKYTAASNYRPKVILDDACPRVAYNNKALWLTGQALDNSSLMVELSPKTIKLIAELYNEGKFE